MKPAMRASSERLMARTVAAALISSAAMSNLAEDPAHTRVQPRLMKSLRAAKNLVVVSALIFGACADDGGRRGGGGTGGPGSPVPTAPMLGPGKPGPDSPDGSSPTSPVDMSMPMVS